MKNLVVNFDKVSNIKEDKLSLNRSKRISSFSSMVYSTLALSGGLNVLESVLFNTDDFVSPLVFAGIGVVGLFGARRSIGEFASCNYKLQKLEEKEKENEMSFIDKENETSKDLSKSK